MSSDYTLRATGLKRSFHIGGHHIVVLRGITLEVPAGERLFLCGASGAGKTTLLYTLAGLERPDEGSVHVGGQDLYALSSNRLAHLRNTLMGYVFQSYFLLPELTALENVSLPAMIRGKAARGAAADLLRKVGLGERLQHLPYELSGGEQQRVAIARALINDPRLLFADEPTGNLDQHTGGEVMDLLLSLVAETKKTLIVVTHDTRLARFGDRTVILAEGQIVSNVASAPAHIASSRQ
ncbi:MAG: ABC transporter ATP-binding protein [Verrucomicrobiales bacterium]